MPRSGCSALNGVNPNLKKKEEQNDVIYSISSSCTHQMLQKYTIVMKLAANKPWPKIFQKRYP